MKIPTPYQNRFVYHFTPIDNLPSILAHGLLSAHEQKRLGLPQRSIVWANLQAHRAGINVPTGPQGHLQDYVPLYFCQLSPLLLAIIGNKVVDEESIIHFEFPIQIMEKYPMVFTDAAISPGSTPNFYTDPAELTHLNWDAINSPAWRMPSPDLRHARLSELLIHLQMPITQAARIIVWDKIVAQHVADLFADFHLAAPRIETDPGLYFINRSADEVTPATLGPNSIHQTYQKTIAYLRAEMGKAPNPRYQGLDDLRNALRLSLDALPETAELIGLETDNKAHIEDVGAHTRRVVSELLKTNEYQDLNEHDQVLLEVTAFLHDIGKGPKSRWAAYGGRQQVDADHPIKALPMLKRIFTQDVAYVPLEDVLLITKLIAYHDLVGGILYSGRRLTELLNVITTERELDMLIGLGKADSTAINPDWLNENLRARLRAAVMADLNRPAVLHPFN